MSGLDHRMASLGKDSARSHISDSNLIDLLANYVEVCVCSLFIGDKISNAEEEEEYQNIV